MSSFFNTYRGRRPEAVINTHALMTESAKLAWRHNATNGPSLNSSAPSTSMCKPTVRPSAPTTPRVHNFWRAKLAFWFRDCPTTHNAMAPIMPRVSSHDQRSPNDVNRTSGNRQFRRIASTRSSRGSHAGSRTTRRTAIAATPNTMTGRRTQVFSMPEPYSFCHRPQECHIEGEHPFYIL